MYSLLLSKYYIPDHFGYNEKNHFSYYFSEDIYFYYTERDVMSFLTIYKSMQRFTENDFICLMNDPSLNICYTNKYVILNYLGL